MPAGNEGGVAMGEISVAKCVARFDPSAMLNYGFVFLRGAPVMHKLKGMPCFSLLVVCILGWPNNQH